MDGWMEQVSGQVCHPTGAPYRRPTIMRNYVTAAMWCAIASCVRVTMR